MILKLLKWVGITALGVLLLCLSPFIILYVTHVVSKPLNNTVLGHLESNYSHFKHPVSSEQMAKPTSLVDAVWGNGDWWGPCVMKINDIRRTSTQENQDKITESYRQANLNEIKSGVPTLDGMVDGFSVSFAGAIKADSYIHRSRLPYDQLWLRRHNEMNKMQEQDPSHLYYLLTLEFPTDMKGADWRCITM